MDRLKLRVMAAIMSFPAGPKMEGSALKSRMDQVAAFIREKPKDDHEGWLIIFEALCKSNPQQVHGNSWKSRLQQLMSNVGAEGSKPAGGIPLDELKRATGETAAKNEAAAKKADDQKAAHAAVIDSAKIDQTEGQKAKAETEAAKVAAKKKKQQAAHDKVIASAKKSE